MENRKTVVIYDSVYAFTQLIESDKSYRIFMNSILQYGLEGIEPNFEENTLKMLWLSTKPAMDANINRYKKAVESGSKSSGNKTPKKIAVDDLPKAEPKAIIKENIQPEVSFLQEIINSENPQPENKLKNKTTKDYLKDFVIPK